MTPKELFSFDLNGYLVVEDFLSAGLLDALNASIDHFADDESRVTWGGEPGSTSAARNPHAAWMISPELAGTHTRGQFVTDPCEWPAPWCHPFRALASHSGMLRYALQLLGNGFRCPQGVGSFLATAGAEGHVLHSGGSGAFGDEASSTLSLGGHMYLSQGGQIWTNNLLVAYQLQDIAPGDGGFLCIPGR